MCVLHVCMCVQTHIVCLWDHNSLINEPIWIGLFTGCIYLLYMYVLYWHNAGHRTARQVEMTCSAWFNCLECVRYTVHLPTQWVPDNHEFLNIDSLTYIIAFLNHVIHDRRKKRVLKVSEWTELDSFVF